MKTIVFQLVGGTYLGRGLFDHRASTLSCFLTDDTGSRGESFIKFIENPKAQETTRNYSCIAKDGDDVLIGCQFDEDPYEDCIRMPQKEFLFMLDQWYKLVKKGPQEIVVFKEGDTYRLEGKGFPDKKD